MYQYDFIKEHYSYRYIIPMQLWLSSKMILFADNRARWDYFFDKAISNPFFDLWSIQIINGHRWIVWPLGSSKTSRSLNIRFSESRSSFSEREKKEQISKSKHPKMRWIITKLSVPFCKFFLEDLCQLSAIRASVHDRPRLSREIFN